MRMSGIYQNLCHSCYNQGNQEYIRKVYEADFESRYNPTCSWQAYATSNRIQVVDDVIQVLARGWMRDLEGQCKLQKDTKSH